MKRAPSPFLASGGEDRICHHLFEKIGVRSRCAVEFGAVDGLYKSNTAYFRQVLGWRVVLLDSNPQSPLVHHALITAENVNEVFRAHDVPDDVDLVSIDIDGNDLWVWKALTYQPQMVVIEYNPRWRPTRNRTVPYDPTRNGWDRTDYYGASAGALMRLGREKGYVLLASTEYNLIFAREGLAAAMPVELIKRSSRNKGRDPLGRPWVGYR
jgi:hypothetical protein